MMIKKIISQSRRDFTALYQCDHEGCDHEHKDYGYDDNFYHTTVIPNMVCPSCGKKAKAKTKKRIPKYADLVAI